MSHADETIPSTGHTPSNNEPNSEAFDAADLTHSLHSSDTGSGQLEVRCPSCHAPTEVAVDTRLTDLTCSACGSHFSLVDQSQETRMAPSLSKLGRFELIERIGVGGFGSVWKARDKELDRTVAVKIPRHGGMTADDQEKFFREARAAAQLRHPSIVSVHEVGRDGDSIYIVSDFVRGVTLGEWLTGQQLTNREATELTAKIADALQHAHEQGVVHRDLKPANIMIDIDGEPHLMDFGLARRDVGEITVTLDGQVLGTPAYMSPEQAEGKGHAADRRSDVYSLGVILFQLLTGELPFRGSARMLIHQVVNDPAPSPRKLNGNVRRDLETITLKCLEKDPTQRYQTAQEFADDLRRYLRGEPIHARPAGFIERGWRWVKRRPTAAALLTLLAAVAIVAPFVATRQSALRRSAQSAELVARNAEKKAREEAARAEKEAATAMRLANVAGAKYALTQERIKDGYQQIAAAIQNQPSLEYGQILNDAIREARREWRLLQRAQVAKSPKWGCFVGMGPEWFVTSDGDKIEVRSLVRDKVLATGNLPGGGAAPAAIGPDRFAVSDGSDQILIYSLPALQQIATCSMPGHVVDIRTDATASRIAALNQEGLVRVFDSGGKQLAERQFPPAGLTFKTTPTLDISPSGKSVSYDPGWWDSPKTVWKWQSGDVRDYDIDTNQLRLESDDVGYTHLDQFGHSGYVQPIALATGETMAGYRGGDMLYSENARLEGVAQGGGKPELALLCDAAINIIPGSDKTATYTRYDTLWPQASKSPRLLSYDCPSHTLALTTDREILVFTRWLTERDQNPQSATGVSTSSALRTATGDFVVLGGSSSVQLYNFRTHSFQSLEMKKPTTQKTMGLRRLAVTPDIKHIAVLWQESDDDKYLRKLVQFYELSPEAAAVKTQLKSEFELKDFFGGSDYVTGELVLTPNARTVVWCDHDWGVAGYRTTDGEKLYQIDAPPDPMYAVAPIPRLLGVGNYRLVDDFHVWNLETGIEVAHFSVDVPVRRVAFAPDSKSLYVASMANELHKHRVSDGERLSTLDTPLAPIAVAPDDNLCIGFITDAERVGSTVLAHLQTGKTLEVINPDAFLLDRAHFSPDGNTIAFESKQGDCMIMKSPDLADAVRRLEQTAIDPQLAAESSDPLDYRERMAARLELHAADMESHDGDQATTLYWNAIKVRKQLAADFTTASNLQETFADSLEVYADKTVEDDPSTADKIIRHALTIRRKLAEAKPGDESFADKLSRTEARSTEAKKRLDAEQRSTAKVWPPGLKPESSSPLDDEDEESDLFEEE